MHLLDVGGFINWKIMFLNIVLIATIGVLLGASRFRIKELSVRMGPNALFSRVVFITDN